MIVLKHFFKILLNIMKKILFLSLNLLKDFIPKLYEMIDNYVNKRKNFVHKEIHEYIINFCGVMINKNSKKFLLFLKMINLKI